MNTNKVVVKIDGVQIRKHFSGTMNNIYKNFNLYAKNKGYDKDILNPEVLGAIAWFNKDKNSYMSIERVLK